MIPRCWLCLAVPEVVSALGLGAPGERGPRAMRSAGIVQGAAASVM